jgi:hypothetical protein
MISCNLLFLYNGVTPQSHGRRRIQCGVEKLCKMWCSYRTGTGCGGVAIGRVWSCSLVGSDVDKPLARACRPQHAGGLSADQQH